MRQMPQTSKQCRTWLVFLRPLGQTSRNGMSEVWPTTSTVQGVCHSLWPQKHLGQLVWDHWVWLFLSMKKPFWGSTATDSLTSPGSGPFNSRCQHKTFDFKSQRTAGERLKQKSFAFIYNSFHRVTVHLEKIMGVNGAILTRIKILVLLYFCVKRQDGHLQWRGFRSPPTAVTQKKWVTQKVGESWWVINHLKTVLCSKVAPKLPFRKVIGQVSRFLCLSDHGMR